MKTPEQIAETLIRGDLLGFILPDEGEVRIPYVKGVIAKAIREAREEASLANYEFKMNECEAEAAKKWTSEHECATVPLWKFWVKTVGARYRCPPSFTYSFTPVGIGDSVIISCHCGAKKDVTDYGSW